MRNETCSTWFSRDHREENRGSTSPEQGWISLSLWVWCGRRGCLYNLMITVIVKVYGTLFALLIFKHKLYHELKSFCHMIPVSMRQTWWLNCTWKFSLYLRNIARKNFKDEISCVGLQANKLYITWYGFIAFQRKKDSIHLFFTLILSSDFDKTQNWSQKGGMWISTSF